MKIWIDLCHIPHVSFFVPQVRELNRRGYETVITVRDRFQMFELCDLAGLNYYKIGRHYGKRFILKGVGIFIRAMQLYRFAYNQHFSIAVNHGSPFQILAASLLGIPTLIFTDYENSYFGTFYRLASRIATPECIPDNAFVNKGVDLRKLTKYSGLKEDVYADDFQPDSAILNELKIDSRRIIVTLRPPSTQAHYHNPQSEQLFSAVLLYLQEMPHVTTVILPRTFEEKINLQNNYNCENGKIIIPSHAVNGLNLIWHSDLVISGGGTMNREAAALGVPVYTIFKGPIGAVDRFLEKTGKLHLIATIVDVTNIKIEKRKKENLHRKTNLKTLLVNEIISTAHTYLKK